MLFRSAAKTQDDKMGQGGEYFSQRRGEEEEEKQESAKYTDRSAQLRATLNSLAMMNVANVINAKKKALEEQNSQKRQNQHQNQKDNDAENKREKAEEELEEEFYNLTREIKEDK